MGKGGAAAAPKAGEADCLHVNASTVVKGDEKLTDPIDKLNFRAQQIAKMYPDNEAYEAIRRTPKGFFDSPEWCVGMGLANPTVYVHRWLWYTALVAAYCVYNIVSFCLAGPNNWLKYLVMLPFIWFYADAFGGILHIVLDTPSNIKLPLIGLASLEFQMHHAIPQDIVIKGLPEACGDLNVIATWGVGAGGLLTGFDPLTMTVGSTLLLASYCGQAAHQAAHKLPKNNPPFVKFLQSVGIFAPNETHRGHHKTHDQDFCILCGWANPLLAAGLKVMPQFDAPAAWITIFALLTLFGPACLANILGTLIAV